jgi:hypothetical protein
MIVGRCKLYGFAAYTAILGALIIIDQHLVHSFF